MKINFLLTECTFLRYYMPLIEEANKRNVSSTVFVGRSGKYNCPQLEQNMSVIHSLSEKHGFALKNISQCSSVTGQTFFTIEGCGLFGNNLNKKNKVYTMSYMTDYIASCKNYLELVDYMILPSFKFADYYDRHTEKNLYLGSPKYDVELDNQKTYKKYDLKQDNKLALIFAPKLRDINKVNLSVLHLWLEHLGYTVVTKSRGKDPIPAQYRGKKYFEDVSWYPHTAMELLNISDLVINFSSTAVKECVLLKKPLINFHIKPFDAHAPFLYEPSYCREMSPTCNFNEFKEAVEYLTMQDHTDSFNKSIKDNLFIAGTVSSKIISHAMS